MTIAKMRQNRGVPAVTPHLVQQPIVQPGSLRLLTAQLVELAAAVARAGLPSSLGRSSPSSTELQHSQQPFRNALKSVMHRSVMSFTNVRLEVSAHKAERLYRGRSVTRYNYIQHGSPHLLWLWPSRSMFCANCM